MKARPAGPPIGQHKQPREMARPHEGIENEPFRLHRAERMPNPGREHPIRIGDVVDHRAQAHEKRVAGKGGDARRRLIRIAIDPAHHPRDMRGLARDLQHETRLGLGRRGLHEDGAVDACPFQQGRKIIGPEIAVDRRQSRGQPAIIAAREAPVMLVAVDPHGPAPDGMSPAAARSAQRRAGTSAAQPARLRSTSRGLTAPRTTEETAGWARAKCIAATGKATRCSAQIAAIRSTLDRISGPASA